MKWGKRCGKPIDKLRFTALIDGYNGSFRVRVTFETSNRFLPEYFTIADDHKNDLCSSHGFFLRI